jgi:hypothetical protein
MATTPKDTKPSTEVAPAKPAKATAVAVPMPGSWRDRMKAVAVKTAEVEKPSGGFISFKSGRLSIGDQLMPGDKIECIVIDSLIHNKFFDTDYNANKVTLPVCYAFAREEENLTPSDGDGKDNPGAEDPQSDYCVDCPRNEWGSSLKGGRGKACSNSKRLFLLPADVVNSPDKVARTDFIQCDLPVTSVANFSKFAMEATSSGLAPFQFVVELSVKPHDKTLFQVYFKPMEQIKDEAILEALAKRNWLNEQQPFPVYPTREELAERDNGGGQKSGKY